MAIQYSMDTAVTCNHIGRAYFFYSLDNGGWGQCDCRWCCAGMAVRVRWGWQQQCHCHHSHLQLLPLPCLHTLLVGRHGAVGLPHVCMSSASSPPPLFPCIPSLPQVHPIVRPHVSVHVRLLAHACLHHACSCLSLPFMFIYLYRIVSINKL